MALTIQSVFLVYSPLPWLHIGYIYLCQASATYGTRAKRGTWNDFQRHAEWIEIQ